MERATGQDEALLRIVRHLSEENIEYAAEALFLLIREGAQRGAALESLSAQQLQLLWQECSWFRELCFTDASVFQKITPAALLELGRDLRYTEMVVEVLVRKALQERGETDFFAQDLNRYEALARSAYVPLEQLIQLGATAETAAKVLHTLAQSSYRFECRYIFIQKHPSMRQEISAAWYRDWHTVILDGELRALEEKYRERAGVSFKQHSFHNTARPEVRGQEPERIKFGKVLWEGTQVVGAYCARKTPYWAYHLGVNSTLCNGFFLATSKPFLAAFAPQVVGTAFLSYEAFRLGRAGYRFFRPESPAEEPHQRTSFSSP